MKFIKVICEPENESQTRSGGLMRQIMWDSSREDDAILHDAERPPTRKDSAPKATGVCQDRELKTVKKLFLLLPVALGFAFVACDEPGFVSVESRGGYYADDADFYYVDRTPYSRNYGPLVYRNNGYYYRRSGSYVAYDRPTRGWRSSDARVREIRRDQHDRHDRRHHDGDARDDRDDRFDDRRDDRRDRFDDRRDDRRDDIRDQRDDVRDDVRDDLRDGRRRTRSLF